MYQNGKYGNVKQEMEKLQVNIPGISETHWKGSGKLSNNIYQLSNLGVRLLKEVWLFSWTKLQQSPLMVIGASQVGL